MEQLNIDYRYRIISDDISKKCQHLLHNIDVNTISDTFDAVKEIVEIAVENYSFKVSESWMDSHSNTDTARKIKFTDVDTGYEILMKKWVNQNPFKAELPECPDNISEPLDEYVARLKKKVFAAGAVGTVAIGATYAYSTSHVAAQAAIGATCSKGWLIFGNPIVAIAAELVGIAILYATVKKKKDVKQQEFKEQMCELEKKQSSYKKNLIETLTLAAELWLKDAETYSKNILANF